MAEILPRPHRAAAFVWGYNTRAALAWGTRCSPAVYRGRPTRRDGQRCQTVHPWRVEDPQVRHADSHPPWGMPAVVRSLDWYQHQQSYR